MGVRGRGAVGLHAEHLGDKASINDVADDQRDHGQKKVNIVWHTVLMYVKVMSRSKIRACEAQICGIRALFK